MTELSLAQSFALVALNAQRSLEFTMAKKAAMRCIAAAVVLEAYLDRIVQITANGQLVVSSELADWMDARTYSKVVFEQILSKEKKISLQACLKKSSGLPVRRLGKLEKAIVDLLTEKDLLQQIPALLSCDLYFHSSGVVIKEYRSDSRTYSGITEFIRAEILEGEPVSEETQCLLWLLRESGCLHDLFSRNELEQVSERMGRLYQTDSLAKQLYPVRIRRGMEQVYTQILRFRKDAVQTQSGSGINFLFPVLERSRSVFIDTEAMFSNPEQRLRDVLGRLEAQGHEYTILREGEIPLLKIDNLVYEAVPHAVYGRVPIHGVRLLPRHPL